MARVGRPPLYNNCLDLEAAIEMYFEECDEGEVREVYDTKSKSVKKIVQKLPYTMAGLSRVCGFATRNALWEYEQKGEFSDTVKRARQRIEEQRNVRMLTGDAAAVPSIFDLKNNFGWVDKHEHHSTQDTRIQVEVVGMPQLPPSAVAVLTGQPQAIEGESVTGLVTSPDDDVVDAEVTTQDD